MFTDAHISSLGYLCEIKQNHHQREFQNALVFYHILVTSSLKKCVEVSLGNGGVYRGPYILTIPKERIL